MEVIKAKRNTLHFWQKMLMTVGVVIIIVSSVRIIGLKAVIQNKVGMIEELEGDLSYEKGIVTSVINSFEMSKQYESIDVMNIPLLTSAGDTIELYTITNRQPSLFLRFSEISCNVCIDSQIDLVNKLMAQYKPLNFSIIASYANPEHMYRFKRLNKVKYEIYNFGGSLTGFQEQEMPFYFVLDSDHVTKDVFFPIRELPQLTDLYFNTVIKKYVLETDSL